MTDSETNEVIDSDVEEEAILQDEEEEEEEELKDASPPRHEQKKKKPLPPHHDIDNEQRDFEFDLSAEQFYELEQQEEREFAEMEKLLELDGADAQEASSTMFKKHQNNNHRSLTLEEEANLASSGFESLLEEEQNQNAKNLYLPLADKLSKQLWIVGTKSGAKSSLEPWRLKRSKEIMQLVKFNSVKYNLYANPPRNHDAFLKLFGPKNSKQAAVQTQERSDAESQTEFVHLSSKQVQHPHLFCGLSEAEEKSSSSSASGASNLNTSCDPFKLASFLQKAEKILSIVLEAEGLCEAIEVKGSEGTKSGSASKSGKKRKLKIPSGSEEFCAACYKLCCSPLAKSSPIAFLRHDGQYLLSVQRIIKEGTKSEKSFLCLWPLEQTLANPEHLLIARSVVTCCASDESGRIFAGMQDGSLALWDLRESRHLHRQILLAGISHTLRSPSFSTACLAGENEAVKHKGAIVGLNKLKANSESEGENGDGVSQMSSVDESGLLMVWELQKTYKSNFSYTNEAVGMLPGTFVKLLRKSVVKPPQDKEEEKDDHPLEVLCAATVPEENGSTVFLGTSCGKVLRSSRFNDRDGTTQLLPLEYKSSLCFKTSGVACIHFNPVRTSSFLVAYIDGTIALFAIQDSEPQQLWDPCDTSISEAICVQWVKSRPSVFVVLDSTSTLYIWDLESSQAPLLNFTLSKLVADFSSLCSK